jgi:tripartite-type tricarboxylate transporter receptor subunit TctC
MKRRSLIASVPALGAVALTGGARAQAKYPDRPIRLVVPFVPGGETDYFGRTWATHAGQKLGQTIVVDNKAGAGGSIGTAEVAKSKPDGYTLLAGTSSTQIINPAAMPKAPYDGVKDFDFVQIVSTTPTAIVVTPGFPAKTLAELIAVCKKEPGKYTYGSAGAGTVTNITGELLKYLTGIDITHVPYKGSAPGLQDVMAGHLQMFTPIFSTGMLELHRAGKLRIISVNSEARLKAAPELPTSIESGVPKMLVPVFNVIATPAGTPKPVIDALSQATDKAKAESAFVTEVEKGGAQVVLNSNPQKATAYISAELTRWKPIIQATNFKVE